MARKVLLINPTLPRKLFLLNIPAALLYLGSYLSSKGYDVLLLDGNNFKHEAFFNLIRRELTGVIAVGLSVMTPQVPSALKISRYVRELDPSVPILWGGVHPTFYPKQTAESPYVDFVVRGEGEVTAFELLEAIVRGNRELKNVRGIAFRSKHSQDVVMTENRVLMNLDKLPAVEWELLKSVSPVRDIRRLSELTESGIYLQTTRGCPHRCAFCINAILKFKYRIRSRELVLKDMERLMDLGVNRISFVDEDFFANKRMVLELLDGMERRGLTPKWYANVRADYFRPDYLNTELLLRLKRCGCEMLGIGAESGSQRILDMLKKDITVEETLNAARSLNKAGIKAYFSFMTGLPGEDEDDFKQTVNMMLKISEIDKSCLFLMYAQQVYRPYPGSELYYECVRRGMREPRSLDEWVNSTYLRDEVDSEHYPWIEYPTNLEDLEQIGFCCWLMGIQLRYRPLMKLVRKIGRVRCRRFFFRFPVEKKIYELLRDLVGRYVYRGLLD